jgi:selenocysteine lyase/cysteine desulfurase
MGPQLRVSVEAGHTAVRAGAAPWNLTSVDWFTDSERLRSLAAQIIGTDTDSVALVPSVSYGIAIAAANVRIGRGQTIVVLEQQFPSNVYAWRELARCVGAEIRTVRRGLTEGWTGPLLEAIDARTALVAVPNCHWSDGGRVDLVRIGTRARAVGAALVVDASQSLGVHPLDIGAVQPDFLVSVGYKWLLGPYSLCYLYAAPRWQREGRPIEQPWINRAGAENFSTLADYRDEYRPGARRFDMGQFSQFTTVPIAIAALEQMLAWGAARIECTLTPLTQLAAQRAEEVGGIVLAEPHRVGHLLGVRLEGLSTAAAGGTGIGPALARDGVYVSVRGDYVRIAPHVHSEANDIERLFAALRTALGRR